MNNRFTLYYALSSMADEYIKNEKRINGSIVGNLIKNIERKGKLRDAQRLAIQIYLWLKEKGNNKKLSDLIKEGTIFNNSMPDLFYPSESLYLDKPVMRYLNRYFQDIKNKNKEDILGQNVSYDEYCKLIDDLFEDFDYPNYLFSLPMGAGKTFLMAIFIYIDLYMYEKTGDDKYAKNFIIIAPSARKTAILPALKTIKLFNPRWILPKVDADRIKRKIKIEILDEIPNDDKLQNQNPNLAKISRTVNGHEYANVFILNAEKVIPNSNLSAEEIDNLSLSQQTKLKRADQIKDALSKLQNVEIFLDEAHHTYSSDTDTKKLRQQLDVINKNKNIKCCIGMSGTPYINRQIKFMNKNIKIQDIQDIVYFYPLTQAIGNFLKTPIIKEVDSNEELLISSALTDFFNNYDITYKNGTKSKIAFYCPSVKKLNEEILPIIFKWYEDNNRNKNEILRYYSKDAGGKEYALPKENKTYFLNLDNPTSKFRVVLLVQIGTEGWDCKSLTSVVLPRQKTAKNFVLQTTCRCLREVNCARNEKALVYLDYSNYKTLDSELNTNYHLHISDINDKQADYKEYPVCEIKENLGDIKYKNIYDKYIEINMSTSQQNIISLLKNYDFSKFKEMHPFTNQVGTTTIEENGLNQNITYASLDIKDYEYTFVDFIYELEQSSFGSISCSSLMKYKEQLKSIYEKIILPNNFSWIINHPSVSTYDVCKDISSIFASKVSCKKEVITEDVCISLLKWNMENKPLIKVTEDDKDKVYPENAYDDIENGIEHYEENQKELLRRYNDKMRIPNKEKSFNYLPYKMDSSYEFIFLQKILQNINNLDIEVYYNGYKNSDLNSLRIITPYGKYTPDFLLIKRNNNIISKILLIETKGKPFETEAKEKFIKDKFLKFNKNYSYIKIGDIKNNINEYNKMVDLIEKFSKN